MTQTETNKLYKSIAADFKIIARKTGLMKLDYCEDILHDIKVMLSNDFLDHISLILDKPTYTPIKVKQFKISSTTREIDERPGGNDWEEDDGERLHVVLSYSQLWHNTSTEEKAVFQKQYLNIGWVSSSVNTNFPQLQKQLTKKYSTGTKGIDRLDYE
jgi:hypothetical protein